MPDFPVAMEARSCHRHWVIWPLFLSAIAASSIGAGRLERPTVAPEELPEGGGDVLVQDDGMIAFSVDDRVFSGMHGAFTVSAHDGHVSTAALTTPVLVRDVDTWTVIPIGFQWRSDGDGAFLPLPAAFQYAKLQELQNVSFSSPSARWDLSVILPAALRLPAAEERREDAVRKQHLSTLARAVARGHSLDRMVQNDAMIAALSSEKGYRMLPSLLAALQDAPHDRALLFPFLFREEEGALLALFHPAFRDHAALLTLDELSPEARAVYRRSLPRSDLLPHALSTLAFSRWEEDVMKEFSEYRNPLPLFVTLLAAIEDVVRESVHHGYIERAQRYIAAAEHLSTSLDLTPELSARLDALPHLLDVPDVAPALVSSSLSAVSSVAAFSEDLKKRVVTDLTAQGGMFIAQTAMEPLSPVSVRVVSLVFATANGDELFDFIYDVEKQEVSDIIRGSTQYPYAVPLQQFREWVRSK